MAGEKDLNPFGRVLLEFLEARGMTVAGEITSFGGSENQPKGWSAAPGGPVKLSLDRAGRITPSFFLFSLPQAQPGSSI